MHHLLAVGTYCEELSLCHMSRLKDDPARLTQRVVVIDATYVLPLDLEAHHQILASTAGRSSERTLCIELLHEPKQPSGVGLSTACKC